MLRTRHDLSTITLLHGEPSLFSFGEQIQAGNWDFADAAISKFSSSCIVNSTEEDPLEGLDAAEDAIVVLQEIVDG